MDILLKQREFFNSNATKNLDFRINALKKLKTTIISHQEDLLSALNYDLNKSRNEAYMSEIYPVLDEINLFLKNLSKWAKPERVKTPFIQFFAKSEIYKEPYGVVLMISPWNYPFQLTMMPLIGAIASGNCVIVKPSRYSSKTAEVIDRIIQTAFSQKHVYTVLGGEGVSETILKEKFDYIFFTGGTTVGKKVMLAAAENLTPVTLELGGKSPCIVDSTANLDLVAQRIVFGKFLNAGQTCVAPDYILVKNNIKQDLINALKNYIIKFYNVDALENVNYPKIINEKHFERLKNLIANSEILFGGEFDGNTLKIEPTLIEADWDSEIMKDEIFGPLLPILEFDNLDDVIERLKDRAKPLALYCFTNDKNVENKILKEVSFGGGCINDTVLHLLNPDLPFGGVGASGIGAYHGKSTFDTFTHRKSVLKKSNSVFFPIHTMSFRHDIDLSKILKK